MLDLIIFITDIIIDLFHYQSFEKLLLNLGSIFCIFVCVFGFIMGYPVICIIGLAGLVYFEVKEWYYCRDYWEERKSRKAESQKSSRK